MLWEADPDIHVPSKRSSLLIFSVFKSEPATVRCLLELEVDPNLTDCYRGYTALGTAFELSNDATRISMLQTLLEWPSINTNIRSKKGSTPLFMAIRKNSLQGIRLFLSHPCIDVNLPDDDGMTPLLEAAGSKSLEVVRLLLEDPRTDTTLKCARRKSLLDYATENLDSEVLELVKVMP